MLKSPAFVAQTIPAVIELIAHGAGTFGMIGGQVLDMQAEGGKWQKLKNHAALLQDIHRHKTAALIRASLQAGATIGRRHPQAADGLRPLWGKYRHGVSNRR